jgi:hypothetical protein
MTMWYRVFGTGEEEPNPAALLERLGPAVAVKFHGDDAGWFRAELACHPDNGPLHLERYLASEEGIRNELNTWAAWVEATGEGPVQARLMQHLIGTRQVFTLWRPESPAEPAAADPICRDLCTWLARQTAGIYQVDEQGFFDAGGKLLLAE